MKNYTGMYIIRPTLTEEGYKAVIADINAIFETKGGKVLEVNEWRSYQVEELGSAPSFVGSQSSNAQALPP